MKNSEINPSRVKENYSRVENYIWEMQQGVKEQFHNDFRKLPRKLQYFIIKLVQEHNRQRGFTNSKSEDIKMILSWIDAYSILNYSEHKIIFYVTELYLKDNN
jgi:hypothetical protein